MNFTQKEAICLARWLGYSQMIVLYEDDFEYMVPCSTIVHGSKDLIIRFIDWLHSPEGQEVLMDRLERGGYWEWHRSKAYFTFNHYQIGKGAIVIKGKPRKEALIQACLKVIQGE